MSYSMNSFVSFVGHLVSSSRQLQSEYHLSSLRLSSGDKYPVGGKGGAMVSLADRFRSQYYAHTEVSNSLSNMNGLMNTQEVYLNNVSDILSEMNRLIISSLDATKTDADRVVLDVEFTALKDEIESIHDNSTYGGVNLFGSSGIAMRYGIESGDTRTLDGLDLKEEVKFDPDQSIDTLANAQGALDAISDLEEGIASLRSTLSINQSTVDRALVQADHAATESLASESAIRDVNIAEESLLSTTLQMRLELTSALIAQAGINAQKTFSLLFPSS